MHSSGGQPPCNSETISSEAERLLREAVRVVPGNPVALHKLALCVKEQARFAEAEALLRQVLELSPKNALALFDLSELEIRSGRYADGWADYESRMAFDDQNEAPPCARPPSARIGRANRWPARRWSCTASRVNGDCLWAVRFLPLLAERAQREGGRVIFGHDGPLRHLFERMLPQGMTLETSLETKPDFHCGLDELAAAVGRGRSIGLGPCRI